MNFDIEVSRNRGPDIDPEILYYLLEGHPKMYPDFGNITGEDFYLQPQAAPNM